MTKRFPWENEQKKEIGTHMKKGLFVVISGPAGTGKGTVIRELLTSEDYVYSVSATTRAPRPGEVDGKNYYFIQRSEFEALIQKGEMMEYTRYCENYYGTPVRQAMQAVEAGKNVILELEVEGALHVKQLFPDAVLIMILSPNFAEQEARLRGRGTETEEVIQKRLARTKEEVPLLPQYDYIVYNQPNGALSCAEDIRTVVRAETMAVRRHPNAVRNYFETETD